jgi:hypothetical protein
MRVEKDGIFAVSPERGFTLNMQAPDSPFLRAGHISVKRLRVRR